MAFRLIVVMKELQVENNPKLDKWVDTTINEDHPTYDLLMERLNKLDAQVIQCAQFYYVPFRN